MGNLLCLEDLAESVSGCGLGSGWKPWMPGALVLLSSRRGCRQEEREEGAG